EDLIARVEGPDVAGAEVFGARAEPLLLDVVQPAEDLLVCGGVEPELALGVGDAGSELAGVHLQLELSEEAALLQVDGLRARLELLVLLTGGEEVVVRLD